MRQVSLLLAAVLLRAAAGPLPGSAQSLTQDEALSLAFPAADSLVRKTAYLEKDRMDRIASATGPDAEPPSGIATFYLAYRGGEPMGVAYFDAHRVRTLDQVLMIVVGREGRVQRVETVRFREPPEYRAPEGWLGLFQEGELGPELSLKGDIPNITGATLTAGAVTQAVRRTLALHREIAPFQAAGGGNAP